MSLSNNFLHQIYWSDLSTITFLFHSSHFSFLAFGHFWRQSYKNTKILNNLCSHFTRQDGKDGKKMERKSHKVTKIPKTKRRKYGMNETFISRKTYVSVFLLIQKSRIHYLTDLFSFLILITACTLLTVGYS